MVELVSTSVMAGLEAIKDGSMIATSKEVARETLELNVREAAKATEFARNQEFMRSFKEYLGNINNDTYLVKAKESITKTPEQALPRLQELKQDNTFKGKIGEAISASRDGTLGEVKEQVYVATVKGFDQGSFVDHVTTLDKPVKYNEVVFDKGEVTLQDFYVKEGTKVATEVKNGGLGYLESEAKGHLIKQVAAGCQIADISMVEINQDCLTEMINAPLRAANPIKQINDTGGTLILGLPDYNSQLDIFFKGV